MINYLWKLEGAYLMRRMRLNCMAHNKALDITIQVIEMTIQVNNKLFQTLKKEFKII